MLNYLKVLEFTPLEFETLKVQNLSLMNCLLEFTPLEFETGDARILGSWTDEIRIYSVGV